MPTRDPNPVYNILAVFYRQSVQSHYLAHQLREVFLKAPGISLFTFGCEALQIDILESAERHSQLLQLRMLQREHDHILEVYLEALQCKTFQA